MQQTHRRTNWYHPFLWASIDAAAKKANWSSHHIVNILQREQPRLFKNLHRGTVYRWLSKTGKGWSDRTLKNVANRHALAGSGRVGILAPYPEIVEEIKTKLMSLRTSGVPINVLVARSIAIAIIQDKKPELLSKFTCSEVSNLNAIALYTVLLTMNAEIHLRIFRERFELVPSKGNTCSRSHP